MEYQIEEQIINKLIRYISRNKSYVQSKRSNPDEPIDNDKFYYYIGYESALNDLREYIDNTIIFNITNIRLQNKEK